MTYEEAEAMALLAGDTLTHVAEFTSYAYCERTGEPNENRDISIRNISALIELEEKADVFVCPECLRILTDSLSIVLERHAPTKEIQP